MIKITKSNVLSRVDSFDTLEEEELFVKSLTFTVPNYWFMPAYKYHGWDGKFSFFNRATRSFLTGLVAILPEVLQENIEVNDIRERPSGFIIPEEITLRGIELRDYQKDSVILALDNERGIITAPTNAGKTECGAALVKYLPGNVLWLTHRGDLQLQTRDRIAERTGEKIGLITRDIFDRRRITVAMVQTLAARLTSNDKKKYKEFLDSCQTIIADECHHTGATTWRQIAKSCPAYFRYGLSATPLLRGEIDNAWLVGLTGKEIRTVTNQDLIARGISARPTIMLVNNSVSSFSKPRYQDAYKSCVEENKERNRIIGKLANMHTLKKEPVLTLVNTLTHMDELRRVMPVGTLFLSGTESTETRYSAIKGMKSGKVFSIVATPIFDEGIDAPAVKVVIMGGAGKSSIRMLQRVGRGMRKKLTGENTVTIYDFVDAGDKFISAHAVERKKIYDREGFDIRVITFDRNGVLVTV